MVSIFMTPRRIQKCVIKMTPETRDVYNRCYSLVMQNVFQRLRFTELETNGMRQRLISDGYIPKVLPKSDQHHIYYNKSGFVQVDGLANSTLMRLYWEKIFGTEIHTRHASYPILQYIVNTLMCSTTSHTCTRCSWTLPINDFHTDTVCIKCHSKLRLLCKGQHFLYTGY